MTLPTDSPPPQPKPGPFHPAKPFNPDVSRKDVVRAQPVREPSQSHADPVHLGQWVGGQGFGYDGSFYLSLPTSATGVALAAFSNESLKPQRSNNQPQKWGIYLLDSTWRPTATLFLGDAEVGAWNILKYAIVNPLIQISGSSVYDTGWTAPDNGVIVVVDYFMNGTQLTFNFDDCGSLSDNPDGDFKDKQVLLWIPLVVKKDFTQVNYVVEGNGNGNLIQLIK